MKGIFFAPNASKPGSLLCKEQTSRFFAQLRGLLTETAAIFIRPEYVPTTIDAQNPANEKTIRSQLRRALAKNH